MDSRIKEICAAAVASIEDDVNEGLVGTSHVGLHVAIFSVSAGQLLYEQGFGATRSRSAVYREIAHDKADTVLEHRRSLGSLMQEGLARGMHNGGFIDGDIVVAVAGAGHLGNVSYGRRVMRSIRERLPSESLAA